MKYLSSVCAIIILFGCKSPVDLEAEKAEIKTQIDLVRQAHIKKDAQLFYQPNDEQWLDIRNGQISHRLRSDAIASTQPYLDDMEFKQMLMREDPVIEISADASLATYSSSGVITGVLNKTPVLWVVAWQNTLKKINGEWKIISTINTEADATQTAKEVLNLARNYTNANDSINSLYAMADCKAPDGRDFKTLIMSSHEHSKMEQQSGDSHFIMKVGALNSWMKDMNTNILSDSLDVAYKTFVYGHELHWLSLFPEDRFSMASFGDITAFNDQTAIKITMMNTMDSPVNFYYSFDNFQPLGFEIFPGENQEKVVITFSNWSEYNSVKLFKRAIFTQGLERFEYSFADIKLNTLTEVDFEEKEAIIQKSDIKVE